MCFSHRDLSKTVWDFTYLCWNLTKSLFAFTQDPSDNIILF